MGYILVETKDSLLGPFIVVLMLITIIGLLSRSSPERIDHSFISNNQKTQYITIGGASTTKSSENG